MKIKKCLANRIILKIKATKTSKLVYFNRMGNLCPPFNIQIVFRRTE